MSGWFERGVTAEEERDVAAYMTRLAAAPPADSPRLPDLDVLLIKGKLLRRWQAERKVEAPLDTAEPFQLAAGAAVAAVLMFWSLSSLTRWLPSL